MRKNFRYNILFSAALIVLALAGCDRGISENSSEESIPAAISETASGTISETGEEISKIQEEIPQEKKGYEPYRIKLYDKVGTGMPRPDDYGEYEVSYSIGGYPEDILSLMKDKAVAEKIRAETEKLFELAEKEYHLYEEGIYELTDEICHTYCNAENGYLFYNICLDRIKNGYIIMSYSAVFDMRTGENLELSDMFFEGEEFLPLLNKKIWENIQRIFGRENYIENYSIDSYYIPVKREFAGLTEGGFYFDAYSFYIPADNPYLASCAGLNVRLVDFDTVLDVPYDMRILFEDGAEEKIIFSERKNSNIISADSCAYSRSYETGNIMVNLFHKSPLLTDEQEEFLAKQAGKIIETKLDELNERLGWEAYRGNEEPEYYADVEKENRKYLSYFNSYIIKCGIYKNNFLYICFQKNYSEVLEKSYNLYFDLETLEPLDSEQLLERVYGGEKIKWELSHVDSKDGLYDKWNSFLRENPPDMSSIEAENFTLRYSNNNLHYYEETDDYLAFWYLTCETEE